MELWSEFEEGTSESARWVRATDALECMDQATIYEERVQRGPQLSEFMKLESRVELPRLQSWVSHLKQEREARWSYRRANTMVIFVLGTVDAGQHLSLNLLSHRRSRCRQEYAMRPTCSRAWLRTYLCGRPLTRRSKITVVRLRRFHRREHARVYHYSPTSHHNAAPKTDERVRAPGAEYVCDRWFSKELRSSVRL